MYPNFLISGAEEPGTSSLSFYISGHSDIFIPSRKELHFFDKNALFKAIAKLNLMFGYKKILPMKEKTREY